MHDELPPLLDKFYYPQILLTLCCEVTVMAGGQGRMGEDLNGPERLCLRQNLGNDCGSLGV